jgi:REP element-mobilizing transposase RayT
MGRKRRRSRQGEFDFKPHGGKRAGAGRKPKGERAGVSHLKRAELASRFPVHVTVRLREDVPGARGRKTREVVRAAFRAGRERFGFRLVQYSVQETHLHLLVEGRDREAVSRGMQGLLIRVAKALNKVWGRKGKVFADRYHDRILRTPREVKNAVRYVLKNAQHHGMVFEGRPDPHSSGPWFDGWRGGSGPSRRRRRRWRGRTRGCCGSGGGGTGCWC